jgi:NTP pyrophosphatase (non-canonical NTP hydrolase)
MVANRDRIGTRRQNFLAYRLRNPEASRSISQDPVKRKKIEEELADVVIYALEFANMTSIDVAAAIETKMAANAAKYPGEKAKGRSDKYTEL